jgi:hypothetical protein
MSWFTENYEKAALGAAIVTTAGLAFVGWSKLNSVEDEFSSAAKGVGIKDSSVAKADSVSTAISSLKLKREWTQKDYDSLPVDLFTGVALFVNKNKLDTPVYLIKGEPVHPPIPNSWWLENKIDPGFGDSPLRDFDEDGFSNIDEFNAKTNPANADEYPALITKLSYLGDESVRWILRPGFETDGAFTFEFGSSKGGNKVDAASPVSPGALFFEKGVAQGRFKLIGSEKRKELNKAIGTEVELTIVKIEDQKPNKKGTTYEIPAGFRKVDANQFAKYDRTAILSLNALGLAGKQMRVEENTEFALPPDAKKKAYKVTEVTPEKVTVEYLDANGKAVSLEIPKSL